MEDSIERRALVLFAVTALVITFGGTLGLIGLGYGSESDVSVVFIAGLVALMLSLALSGLAIAPLREGALVWSRSSLLNWAIFLLVVGVGFFALVASVAANGLTIGVDSS
jgi:hypothetical protein